MEHADRGRQTLITEIRIELRQIGRHHQAFIDDVLVRQTADIELSVGQSDLSPTAGEEQLDAEVTLGQAGARHVNLLDARQALEGEAAKYAGVHRHFTPADQRQPLCRNLFVEARTRNVGFAGILAKEDHADRILIR
ncbi:hypothetical protein SSTU70S_03178 [Stutzerimonas stutzeri]